MAVTASRNGETKVGTQYRDYTVRGVTNSWHEGFSEARLDELADVLTVLSVNEDREAFISDFLGAADHFFRQEDAVLKRVDEEEQALKDIVKTLKFVEQREDLIRGSLCVLGQSTGLESLHAFRTTFEKIINDSQKNIEKQRVFNRLNNYSQGNVGQGNKEAIVKLYSLFIKVLKNYFLVIK